MKRLLGILLILALAVPVWGADVKISELPVVTSVTAATDVVPVVASGATSQVTVTNLMKGANAGTATALAADPADCAAGQVATGIAASGALTCTATPSVTTLTGAVTGTASGNIPNSLADAKGDLAVASADNTWGRMAHPGAANYVLTTNATDTYLWSATHSHSDSAAQFYDATTTTNTVKIDAPTDTDGSIDAILDFSGVADADKTFTFPNATGTVALVKNEKLASFAWDNGASAVATAGSKRCVAIPYAATIVGHTMVISGDPGAGGTILNITKDAWSDSSLPTTEIDASAPPTVADNKVASTDSTLTGWTKTVAANDIICADVATNAVATWISLTIFGTK